MNQFQHPACRPGGEWILAVLLICTFGLLAVTVGFACRSTTRLAAEDDWSHRHPALEQRP